MLSRTRLLLSALFAGLLVVPASAPAAELSASASSLRSVYAAASSGDVIRLASGDYGSFTGGTRSGTVTVTAQAGAVATIDLNLSGANNLRFDGVTIDGGSITDSRNIAIVNSTFTGSTILSQKIANANITLDRNRFLNISPCSSCNEGRLTVSASDTPQGPSGIKITNSLFSGGFSDGVQLVGQAQGVQIGPGNEFSDLRQGSAAHTDPIQTYGALDTTIVGNFIHDSSTSIMVPDGQDGGTMRISDNVFTRIEQAGAYIGFQPNIQVIHNTSTEPLIFNDDPGKRSQGGGATTGAVIRDNILTGGIVFQNGAGAGRSMDYNLVPGGGGGTNGISSGSPTFAGGAAPSTLAGFLLTSSSVGAGKASDGLDLGIRRDVISGTATPAPAPTPAPTTPKPPTTKPPAKPTNGTPATQAEAEATGAPSIVPGAAATAPAITLIRPTAGGEFGRRVSVAAYASDDSGVARVEFWIDGQLMARDAKAPYRRKLRVSGLAYGNHTIVARVYAKDGASASSAIVSRYVRRVRAASKAGSTRWQVAAAPAAAGGTVLSGIGKARKRVTVSITRCGDSRGRRVGRIHLRVARNGRISGRSKRTGVCVLGVRAG